MLHDTEPRHGDARLKGTEGLTVLAEEFIEQTTPRRIGQRLEDRIHCRSIRDHYVTCQAIWASLQIPAGGVICTKRTPCTSTHIKLSEFRVCCKLGYVR